ncbi:hypothetical protein HK104_003525 [Borealophlyctis nickersoniae]|nr:hypothetical protein HK104_003525 [Borealophlyctis nickersoniae]
MPEKDPTIHPLFSRTKAMGHISKSRNALILSVVAVIVLLKWWFARSVFTPPLKRYHIGGLLEEGRVPVELFVMSKCPDAVFCEREFLKILVKVGNITSITTSYIATPSDDAPYAAKCLHGDSECLGNIQQLCVRNNYPNPAQWYNFIICQDRFYQSIPSEQLAQKCAEAVGVNYARVKSCVDGAEGKTLLRASVERTKEMGGAVRFTLTARNGVYMMVVGPIVLEDTGKEISSSRFAMPILLTQSRPHAMIREASNLYL